jgi:protein-tyrosine phosphatase
MLPTVIDWSPAVDPSAFVSQVRDALNANAAVVLPGDRGYLALWKPGTPVSLPSPAILTFGPDEAATVAGPLPALARRLMFRGWPAPLIIEVPATADSPFATNGHIAFRFPDHPIFETVFPAIADLGCVFVADTGAPTVTAAVAQLGDVVAVAVNAGERPTDLAITRVRVTESGYNILEEGAFAKDEIDRLTARIILFVCTGNTCRSPLAEALAKKRLAERLECDERDLPARGFWVLSAGVAAYGGSPASDESRVIASEFGGNLELHASRPVNPQLLLAADDVIVMTRSHLYALASRFPQFGPQPQLLCGDSDLDDPIGAGIEVYRECAQTILRHLDRFLSDWVKS